MKNWLTILSLGAILLCGSGIAAADPLKEDRARTTDRSAKPGMENLLGTEEGTSTQPGQLTGNPQNTQEINPTPLNFLSNEWDRYFGVQY